MSLERGCQRLSAEGARAEAPRGSLRECIFQFFEGKWRVLMLSGTLFKVNVLATEGLTADFHALCM